MKVKKTTMAKKIAIAKFEDACRLLNEVVDVGYELYVSGSGSLHLMKGPSHVGNGVPQRQNIVHTVHVSSLSGGDW